MTKAKQAAGRAAAELVTDGMCLGLGTGSTTAYALEALGRRIDAGDLSDVCGIPTSFSAQRLARTHGIPLTTLDDNSVVDLAIDGADEIDSDLNLVKGRGGAHVREKIVAAQADKFVVVADETKCVDRLGASMPVPVEVVPMAVRPVSDRLEALGATPELREGVSKDGPVVTDQGLWIVDALFDGIDDPRGVARTIKGFPGVLDHGLFIAMATRALVGRPDGTVRVMPVTR
jgi:ribose 5-phosphate isomerase A